LDAFAESKGKEVAQASQKERKDVVRMQAMSARAFYK